MMKNIKNTDNGFTLVELAIIMIVAGILLSAAVRSYDLFAGDRVRLETLDNIEAVNSAIALFQAVHGRYPCPARLTAQIGDADYGEEIDCSSAFPIMSPDVDRTLGRDADNIPGGDGVLIGGVPFVTLELAPNQFTNVLEPVLLDLSSQQILDGWGNKLTYAVTENLVHGPPDFSEDLGAISIEDEFGTGGGREPSLVDPPGSAHFVVKSAGQNGRGAYTTNGIRVGNPCTGGAVILPPPAAPPQVSSGSTVEYENCDDDDLFVSALRSDVDGNNYNDDIVSFQVFVATDLWEFAPGPGGAGATVPGSIRNKNLGNVYIGTPAVLPDPDNALLNVAGKLKATEQTTFVRICGPTGIGDCFEPGLLAGDGSNPALDTDGNDPSGKLGMKCSDTTHLMKGIEEGHPKCASPFSGFSVPDQTCPAGEYMRGISTNGTILCAPF